MSGWHNPHIHLPLSGKPDSNNDTDSVSPVYLEMMGVKLIAGRLIRETDTADTPKVAVVDQTLANALWPGQNTIGHFFDIPPNQSGDRWWQPVTALRMD